MACPRCGFAGSSGPTCSRCGVVFAKIREDRPRPVSAPPPSPAPSTSSTANVVWSMVLAGVLGLAAVGWVRVRQPRPPVILPAPAVGSVPVDPAAPPPAVQDPEAAPAALPPPSASVAAEPPARIPPADEVLFTRLTDKIRAGALIDPKDVEDAAALQARYPHEVALGQLLTEMLIGLAYRQSQERRPADAVATLRRAAAMPSADDRVQSALLTALMNASDWSGVEAYANELLGRDRMNVEAWYSLGYALFRLDRNREAAGALRSCLEVRDDARARVLLARLEKTSADERGMTERQLSHFHVRYDGQEHDDVGREVLRALERHYATLVIDLDHRPQSAIPVILFSSQQYYDASGAPAWSGGQYDSMDGRIRLPIGGLTRSLTPDLDDTLIHELTHAFIADKSRGVAPREIHEGLAQYMEGKRADDRVSTALVDGRISGVHGFYLGALSFVEYLIGLRGQGAMNELLGVMGDTGNVDAAFRKVHGSGYAEVQAAWRKRLEQKYGG